MIEVKLLGPPRVERDGALVAFDTRKAVALLAHLALADRPRPRDALAELLWPDTDPERARGALRRTLTTLRTAIGAQFVEATRDHVHLVKGPGIAVDVDRFRQLRAGQELELAVQQFRGDFLDGFAVKDAPAFEDWAHGEADALRRELTATLAGLADVREAAGDFVGAVRVVQRWLSLDPLHEPAHRALIRLYAASGDRAAALVQYRECVRALSRELGVAPLRETTELYEAVNRGSLPAAEQAPPTTRLPDVVAQSSPLVGRADEVRALRASFDDIRSNGKVVLIEGEAGIGKTRLAEEFLAWLRQRGARVLTGRAYEGEAGLAYAPVIEALRGRLSYEDDTWLEIAGERVVGEAARLVPELTERLADRPAAFDGPGAQSRFLAGVWDALGAAAAGPVPGVLFIDDVQWADDATLGLLTYGLRRLPGRPLLVVLTWRTPHDHSARPTIAELARTGGMVLHLERLDESAVGELVRAARPDDLDPATAARLWRTTEGVPLLVVEYLRSAGDDAGVVPSGVRALYSGRLDPVSETGRQVLAAAAVLGRSFGVDTVRAVSGRTDDETVTALEEVVRRGLIRERNLDYDFVHELVRTLVYEEASLARRRLLHGRAADVIGAPAAVVARHQQLAGRDADAASTFLLAGTQAREVFANAEALSHFRAAVALGHPEATWLHTAIGDLLTVLGDYGGALASYETAAASGQPAELSAVEHRLGRLQHRRGEYALAEAHLHAALTSAAPEDASARAGITADLSLAAHSRGAGRLARTLAEEALSLAEKAGDHRSLCQAYNLLGMLDTTDGNPDAALGHLQRSRALADELGDQDLRVAVRNNLALTYRARGDLRDATALTVEALGLCEAMGDRHRAAALHNNLADLLHASGLAEDAMAHLKAAVEIFAEIGAEEPRPEIWKLVRW